MKTPRSDAVAAKPKPFDLKTCPIILVAGDVSIDWLFFEESSPNQEADGPTGRRREREPAGRRATDESERWRFRKRVETVAIHGGAWILETGVKDLLRQAYQDRDKGEEIDKAVVGYRRLAVDYLRAADPNVIVNTATEFKLHVRSGDDENDLVYRAASDIRYWGVSELDKQAQPFLQPTPKGQPDPDLSEPEPRATLKRVDSLLKTHRWWEAVAVPRVFPRARRQVIVIQDTSDGFTQKKKSWLPLLPVPEEGDPERFVILCVKNPKGLGGALKERSARAGDARRGEFFRHIRQHYRDRTVIVSNANALREAGVNISRSLSWERTAYDFVKQLTQHPDLSALAACAEHMVIRFDLNAAIHHHGRGKTAQTTLYFDPQHVENEYGGSSLGRMSGRNSLIAATLAVALFQVLEEGRGGRDVLGDSLFEKNIPAALANCRCLHREGFKAYKHLSMLRIEIEYWDDVIRGPEQRVKRYEKAKLAGALPEPDGPPAWPVRVHAEPEEAAKFFRVAVQPQGPDWTILSGDKRRLLTLAESIVRLGLEKAIEGVKQSERFPFVRFGKLVAVDRQEIEGYRSIRNTMREYLERDKVQRPLCIAVFGPPGAGKSFGVTELAGTITRGRRDPLVFNLTQFTAADDLSLALVRAREESLSERAPLIFFDEFDSQPTFESLGHLGWLKFFLSVMQDGQFKHHGTTLSIGRSIFVFAGGTHRTYREFIAEERREGETKRALANRKNAFKQAKGPDFVSRLRGHLNIVGPDPSDRKDKAFLVRRAIQLNSLLSRHYRHLLRGPNPEPIDAAVLRALLDENTRYTHGARSMEAILEMSALAKARRLDKYSLPADEQLSMHVHDLERFVKLVNGEGRSG